MKHIAKTPIQKGVAFVLAVAIGVLVAIMVIKLLENF